VVVALSKPGREQSRGRDEEGKCKPCSFVCVCVFVKIDDNNGSTLA